MKTNDGPEIQAIPTTYKGIEFRSRLEASVAQFMDRLGWTWEYEPQSFLLPSGVHYRPDFLVLRGRRKLWVECRGYESSKGQAQLDEFTEFLSDTQSLNSFLVLQSGENYSCRYTNRFCIPDSGSGPWLFLCQACGKYDVSTADQLDQGACEYCCGCPSARLAIERIEFRDLVLYVGDHPISKWRPS